MRFPATLLAIAFLASTAGCAARIVWSPDGTRAAYQNEEHLYLIDDQGNLVERLGPSAGAFAWAPDSTTLYFATPADPGANTTAVDRDWLPTTPDAVAWRPADTVKGKFTVHRWRDGLRKPLFTLRTDGVVHLAVSPSEQWLAAVSSISESSPDDPRLQLFV